MLSVWFPFPPTLPGWYEVLPLQSTNYTRENAVRWKKIYGYVPRLVLVQHRHWDGERWSDPVDLDASWDRRVAAMKTRRLPRQLNTSTLWRGRIEEGWPPRPFAIRVAML